MENMTMKDGTHPIQVKSKQVIPDGYNGWMFGPVSVLTDLNYNEFEWHGTSFKGYYNKNDGKNNIFNHIATDDMVSINGKRQFHGIVFRRKASI